MKLDIRSVESAEDMKFIFPILKELRTDLTFENFTSIYQQAKQRDEYRLVGIFEGQACLAVMGYRTLFDFVHGKHLYVDDLVVTANLRSKGLGEMLLNFAEVEANKLGCQGLRLCTGVENEAGKCFYVRNGWNLRAVAFKKPLA